jgi:ferredoxin-nitrite reductase
MRVGGGLGGKEPRRARSLDVFVPPEKGYEAVRGFVELYHDHGDRQQRSKNRSRFFVDEWGTAEIRELLQAEYVDFELPTAGRNFRDEYVYNAGRSDDRGLTDYVGVHDQDEESKFVGLSVPVGRLPAEDALALADLAEAYGSGEVRLTRRQNPLVMDVPSDEIDDLLAEPLLEKYPPEPSPFQRGGMACTGTEFCSLALTETKARLARMLRWLRENVDLPDDVDHLHVHFSGCTADCGHANTADIGLLGMRARKDGEMVEAMDIGVGGGLGTEPSFVEWIHQRVPADEVPGALKNLVEAFAAHREERVVPPERRNGDGAAVEGQTFREWCSETGTEALVELCEPEETTYEDPYLTDAKRAWYPFAEEETAPEAADVAADD